MHDLGALGGFLISLTIVSLVWGRALWYLDERSHAFRRLAFFFIGFTHRPVGQVRAVLLTVIYCLPGLAAVLVFAVGFGLSPVHFVSFSASLAIISLLGAIGEISLADLLVTFTCMLGGPRMQARLQEMKDIPWMKGLRQLPARLVPIGAAMGGVVEELFFRGVVLLVLIDRFDVPPFAAVMIAGALFCLEQLVQLQTTFQMLVIGCGCVAISAVGGLLVLLTGSVVPALICHASFVLFFVTNNGEPAEGPARAKMRTPAR